MISSVLTGGLYGLDAYPIQVEIDLSNGIPGLTIVGLPDKAVNESKERIRSAIKNSGFEFPLKKILINLAPAHLPKEGTGFDLPICVGILLASEMLAATDFINKTCFIGEVSLEGSLRPVQGILAMAMMAKEQGFKYLVVPEENRAEASLVEGVEVYGLTHLKELPIFFLHPQSYLKPIDQKQWLQSAERQSSQRPLVDFADIKGQETAKRALEIAAAGGHNVLMVGPPGSGKSMLAKALSGILPPMTFDEMLEVSRIYSVAGLLIRDAKINPTSEVSSRQAFELMTKRPFRSPHHSASRAGLTGGGSSPKPGEITLAHRGVLFLDEIVECPRNTLEILRQPLEDGVVTISRAQHTMTFPARFMLVAAMNPCPCGHLGDAVKGCSDTDMQVQRYINRLSGPLLDRIDLHLEVPRLNEMEILGSEIQAEAKKETSAQIRERVLKARQIQLDRFASLRAEGQMIYSNAEMTPAQIKQFCVLDHAGKEVMRRAVQRLNLTARAFDRVLRLARTIADLSGVELVQSTHIAEALQYRATEKLYKNKLGGAASSVGQPGLVQPIPVQSAVVHKPVSSEREPYKAVS